MKSIEEIKREMEYFEDCVSTMEEWLDGYLCGGFTDNDGWGHPHDGEKELEDVDLTELVRETELSYDEFLKKYPYAIWYNK